MSNVFIEINLASQQEQFKFLQETERYLPIDHPKRIKLLLVINEISVYIKELEEQLEQSNKK